jgi:hypothetical protein
MRTTSISCSVSNCLMPLLRAMKQPVRPMPALGEGHGSVPEARVSCASTCSERRRGPSVGSPWSALHDSVRHDETVRSMIETRSDRIDRAMLRSQNVEVNMSSHALTCVPVVIDLVLSVVELNRRCTRWTNAVCERCEFTSITNRRTS